MTSTSSNNPHSLHLTASIWLLGVMLLSGCTTYIASKQDNVLGQIDIWYSDNEFGKAFDTIDYVKTTHPQYQDLQKRRKLLQDEARKYEKTVHRKIVQFIQKKHWAEALDLIDEAQKKYPQGKQLPKTRAFLLKQQKIQLTLIDRNIMLERSQWMIATRPIYKSKLNTDPRNHQLKRQLEELDQESEQLAQQLTELSRQAIKNQHYITARTHIDMAIALAPSKERKKIAARLKTRAQKTYQKLQQAKKKSHQKKQTSLLQDIERNFKSGNLIEARQLISRLDAKERNNPELLQLERELERSINYTIQGYYAEANRHYADGDFQEAIILWEQVLQYDPDNAIAIKNINRAQKVIKKLSHLREKQQN